MRSEVRRLHAPAVALLALGALHACSEGGSTGPDPNEVATVTITAAGATSIPLNGTVQLQANLRNQQGGTATAQVSWNSQTTAVAQVTAAGLVTGVGLGSSLVTASAGGKSNQVTVTVTDPNPPSPPSNLQATVISNIRIDLTWTDGSTNEETIRVERGPVVSAAGVAFAEVANLPAGTTSHSDTGLNPNQAYAYRVRACNQNGCSAFTSEVEGATFPELEIQTAALPGGTVNTAYSQTLTATGGSGAPVWGVTSGSLPPGLTLAGVTGVIGGTPTTAGAFDFTVQAAGGGQTVGRPLEIQISAEILAPVVTTTTLPNAIRGTPYDQTLAASQGDGTYTWAVSGGALPGNLSLSAAGRITGTPSAAGAFDFTAQVTSATLVGTRDLSIQAVHPPVQITTSSLPGAVLGLAYSQSLEATGGDDTSYDTDQSGQVWQTSQILGSVVLISVFTMIFVTILSLILIRRDDVKPAAP